MQTPDRAALYARLKLAGLDDAPCQLAVFSDRSTAQGAGLGRLTMPQTLDYSVVNAVHTLWLAARAEGIGLGWVSILDPARIAEILDVPPDWVFIGHLCVGYPLKEDDTPALEREGWEHRHAPKERRAVSVGSRARRNRHTAQAGIQPLKPVPSWPGFRRDDVALVIPAQPRLPNRAYHALTSSTEGRDHEAS